jgi:hypothetical protein
VATSPPPPSASASATSPTAPAGPVASAGAPRRRRRIPTLGAALGGALAAGAYAHFAFTMRLGPPLVMVALGGMTLVLTAAALWRVVDPLTHDEVRAAPLKRAPHRIRELEREKQAVLKAIKEIELDYQMRKIAEPDYREMVERYRARALRVMGELASGDDYRALIERELRDRLAVMRATAGAQVHEAKGPSVAVEAAAAPRASAVADQTEKISDPAVAACAACATANDLDARFCKRCGRPLAGRPEERAATPPAGESSGGGAA